MRGCKLKGSQKQFQTKEIEMKKYMFALMVLSLSLALAVPAYSTTCSGTVTYLGLGGNTVTVAGPGGLPPVYVCSVDGGTPGWSAEACKAAYATLLAAKMSGQTATIFFSDALACANEPAWSSATLGNIYHVATQ